MELLELRRQLEKAVKDEDYELAAKLRDEMNESQN
jgi:protein-arginine kinase activator protein McsA